MALEKDKNAQSDNSIIVNCKRRRQNVNIFTFLPANVDESEKNDPVYGIPFLKWPLMNDFIPNSWDSAVKDADYGIDA